ncbi:hypothetical protein [Burkholderia ubonensis]|uniref:hypothetical protein n=1 Tax=Burkholderia ubonensis TaxID=101571 RepID=UPI0012FB5035|nr:hypothetical protein [Burkholderia ubonensis]
MTSSNACRASIATRTAHSFGKIPRSTGKRATAWSATGIAITNGCTSERMTML